MWGEASLYASPQRLGLLRRLSEFDKKVSFSNQLARQLKLKIADIIIEARCAGPDIGLATSQAMQRFLVKDGQPDCVIGVNYGPLPDIEMERELFTPGGGPWALYSSGQKLVFQLLANRNGETYAHRMAIFEPGFERGELFICPAFKLSVTGPMPLEKERMVSLDPFIPPLDELVVVNLLAIERGLHIHALGIIYKGRGLVFSGVSGAGKSTMAELWKKKGVKILSDDRISLRRQDGRVWAHGTPWHGDARISLPEKAPVEAIYFIVHGQENRVLPLNTGEAASRFMVRCFPTFYLRRGMEFTLRFIDELAHTVPCYELQFTPDQRAIDEVLNHVESLALSSR